jgi:hypothetical protein
MKPTMMTNSTWSAAQARPVERDLAGYGMTAAQAQERLGRMEFDEPVHLMG